MEGNQMKMREALELFVEYSKLVCRMGIFTRDRLVEITTKAQAALSAPPRNCDVGTAEEQDRRMTDFCNSYHCEDCPVYNSESCALAWSQMPYEEGCSK